MAETAAILAPDRTVLIPDLEAGCSLAASIDAEALSRWKDENPGAIVVSYVNTSAEVKALSDYCCTSGNARAVIEAVPEDRDILFLPDMFLGAYLEKLTGRRMKIWPGECHVHAGIRPEDVTRMMEERPDTDLLIHPECGCASQCMYAAAHDAKLSETTHVLSTEGMVRHATASPRREFVVATETGILHRLRKEAPEKRFYAMSERAVCRYMKQITLPKLRDSLRDLRYQVTVPDEIADRARLAIERMVEIA
jgi:quinolinate synthase